MKYIPIVLLVLILNSCATSRIYKIFQPQSGATLTANYKGELKARSNLIKTSRAEDIYEEVGLAVNTAYSPIKHLGIQAGVNLHENNLLCTTAMGFYHTIDTEGQSICLDIYMGYTSRKFLYERATYNADEIFVRPGVHFLVNEYFSLNLYVQPTLFDVRTITLMDGYPFHTNIPLDKTKYSAAGVGVDLKYDAVGLSIETSFGSPFRQRGFLSDALSIGASINCRF